jgi:hypothetical protein
MSDDFRKLIEEIEAEAKAEGPAVEAELRDLRREFSAEAERMGLRIAPPAIILSAAAPPGRKSSQQPSNPDPRE